MKVKRKKRVRFTTCEDDHESPQIARPVLRLSPCHAESGVLSCALCFLLVCTVAIIFFLSQSDLTVQGTSWLWGKKGRECKRDKDCATRLRKDFDTLSWGQCLLPPNGTATCVDHKCVDPPARPVMSALPCDDNSWCTVNDKCTPGKGECSGIGRGCHDVDFCTLEVCSEHLEACVSMDAAESSVCENTCVLDRDCRSEYYCANGRCADFKAKNESLFFSAYEIVPCMDDPDDYSMLQHYIVYEQGYSLDLHDKHENEGFRYRAIRSSEDVFFPELPEDHFNIPLASISSVQTRVVPKTETTPAYSEITLSVRTECQSLPDASTCLTKWMNRRYDFELDLEDCVIDPGDPQGPVLGTTLGECLPVKIRRAYSMNLDVIDCPFFTHSALIPPLSRLRLQSPGETEELDIVLSGDWVQAVVELDAEQQKEFPVMINQSPFLSSATVCTVDPTHRLAGCATGEQTANCPFRGCIGWSGVFNDDSPLTSIRKYMADSERLSAAIQDGVDFCRGLGYSNQGCVPGACSWGANAYQPPFGSADGFLFRASGFAGQIIVVDVAFRMQYCGEGENTTSSRRRLSKFSYRSSAVFKLHETTQVSDLEPSKP